MKNIYRFSMLVGFVLFLSACVVGGRGKPTIISDFADTHGRSGAHAGVDFVGNSTILAAADGIVYTVRTPNFNTGCGGQIIIWHIEKARFTAYCHLSSIDVEEGSLVRRGEVIGQMGDTGSGNWPVHLHFEVNSVGKSHEDGVLWEGKSLENPSKYIVGCFDPSATYPENEFVLTYPVSCD
ncbi:MAG: M23 family metallopeptidase [Candidatus Paceibacterota bacterium]